MPILIIAILGITVVGGGGYAVYKVNQIEEESSSRVTELERKFEEVNNPAITTQVIAMTDSTTTDDIATSSEEAVIPEAVRKDTETIAVQDNSIKSDDFNYIGVLSNYWNSEVKLSEQLKSILIKQKNIAQDRLNNLSPLYSTAKSDSRSSNDFISSRAEIIAEYVELDMGSSQRMVSIMNEYIGYLDTNISDGKNALAQAYGVAWNREQALNFINEKKQTDDVNKIISDASNEIWEIYISDNNQKDDFYQQLASQLAQETVIPVYINYQPVVTPKYETPKTQRTFCNVFDGSISCETTF